MSRQAFCGLIAGAAGGPIFFPTHSAQFCHFQPPHAVASDCLEDASEPFKGKTMIGRGFVGGVLMIDKAYPLALLAQSFSPLTLLSSMPFEDLPQWVAQLWISKTNSRVSTYSKMLAQAILR
jgi:hypothetical protein